MKNSISNKFQLAISNKQIITYKITVAFRILLIVFSILIIASCGNQTETEQLTEEVETNTVVLTEAQQKNSEIQVSKLEQKTISSILRANGIIEVPPQNLVSVSVPLGGYLKSTKLIAGMHVSKGESIATMEDIQYIELQQEFLIAKAQFNSIEKDYQRQKELNLSKAGSDKVFEKTEADYSGQKVLLKSLEEKLKLIYIQPEKLNEDNISRSIQIPSPISGFVKSVNVNIGKYINPSDVLFELVDPTDIHLALTVFEKDLDKLFIGQKLLAYTNSNPEKKYECEVILIGKDISMDRSVVVHCHFEEYDKVLLPGMYMNAELKVTTESAPSIAENAIVHYGGKNYVFNQTENLTYHLLEVNVLNSENGFTQISFLDDTDFSNKLFVTQGAYSLLMKLKNISNEE